MYLIVGLGNPEPEFSLTRHNMGFDVINKLSEKYNIEVERNGFDSLYGSGIIENEKVLLVKPQTYMNLSGNAVSQIIKFYKIKIDDILVIHDDMDIEPGNIKLKPKGSAAGHNGIKSIISELNTEEFKRLRVGIGRTENKNEKVDYVIGKLESNEYQILEKGIDKSVEAIEEYIINGFNSAMNKFN